MRGSLDTTGPTTLTLASAGDADNFTLGQPMVMTMSGALRRQTWIDRLRRWISRLLWWREARSIVVDIDHDSGSVTVAPLRWSWRRWRWVRA